jgi:hypothetical protein
MISASSIACLAGPPRRENLCAAGPVHTPNHDPRNQSEAFAAAQRTRVTVGLPRLDLQMPARSR